MFVVCPGANARDLLNSAEQDPTQLLPWERRFVILGTCWIIVANVRKVTICRLLVHEGLLTTHHHHLIFVSYLAHRSHSHLPPWDRIVTCLWVCVSFSLHFFYSPSPGSQASSTPTATVELPPPKPHRKCFPGQHLHLTRVNPHPCLPALLLFVFLNHLDSYASLNPNATIFIGFSDTTTLTVYSNTPTSNIPSSDKLTQQNIDNNNRARANNSCRA